MAQTIIVDISTRGANPVAYTHQGDTGRTFFAEIYENGEAFAVAGYTIKVGAILPADRGYYVIAGNDMVTATKTNDNTTNKIYFTLSENYSLKAGNGILTLIFTSNTGTPSTIRPINIDLRIQKSADADDTIAGASDFPEGLEAIAEEVFQEYLSTYLPPVAPSASAAANKAADAKLTGEALDDLKSDLIADELAITGNYDILSTATWVDGIYINGQGVETANSSFQTTEQIPVSTGETYTFSYIPISGAITRFAAYDADSSFVSFLYYSETKTVGDYTIYTYLIPSGITSIRLSKPKRLQACCMSKGNALVDAIASLSQKDTELTAIVGRQKKVYLNCNNVIRFNTESKTITFPKSFYLVIDKSRHDYEATDVVVEYGSVSGNMVSVVVDDSWNITAKATTAVGNETVLFSFAKNGLSNPATNNIFYPYYADGVLYNGTDTSGTNKKAVYVDAETGSDTNTGTKTDPFATIQKGINSGANSVFVARGTYDETITISNKTDLEILPSATPTFSVPNFDVPMIIVNNVVVQNSRNLHFCDIHANNPSADSASWHINRAENVLFEHCYASNGQAGGFVTINLYGKFIMCKAWDIGDSSHTNSDGFNLHGYGVTELIDCVAHDCYDDGISHHDGCIASIKGGEFWNCTHGGGIAPVNRYCEIDGVYVHDCYMGLESTQSDATLYDPYILVKNSAFKDSTNYDIRCGDIPMKVIRCTFDTKSIGSNAEYVEIPFA